MDLYWHPLWTLSLLLQSLFQAMEVAFLTAQKSALERQSGAARIFFFKSRPDRLYGVTRSGYLLAMGGGILGVADLYNRSQPYGGWAFLLSALGFLVLSLGPGYLWPRALAARFSVSLARLFVWPAVLLQYLLWPLYGPMLHLSKALLGLFRLEVNFELARPEDELQQMLAESLKAGTIQDAEHEFIANILEFSDTVAREIMVPRVEIEALDVDSDREDWEAAIQLNYSRLPVYKETMDNIIGVLNVKDLMRAVVTGQDVVIQNLVRPAYFVPVSMKIGSILSQMQKNKNRMAIVIDEYGGTAGMLTMEDILEEIVGEIQEATVLTEEEDIRMLADQTYMVRGSCSIDDFNEYFAVELPESESYNSLAGLVIERMGRFPEVGEKFVTEDFSFELTRKVRQKLEQFRVIRLRVPSEESSLLGSLH
ncbi:MAG: HlyC/CorC family transporter [Spirochaetales bacterium]|nr:HlyC/CorC family transporter [Spirochaetales bacterium]